MTSINKSRISWKSATWRFLKNGRYTPVKILIGLCICLLPVEVVAEFIPGVDLAEDAGLGAIGLRVLYVIWQIKKGQK